jgi:predicted HAD superfamily hydrolase
VPASKGIKTTLVTTGLNKYEHAWNSQAFAVNQPYDVYLMSGIAKSIRLSHPSSVHNDIVLNAIAPLFVPFVSWMLRDARQRGIKKLYFLARDGYVLHEIAKILGVNYPEIELHYLYGSRRAFYLAGVKHASMDELNWIFPPVVGKTPRQMLKRINADESVIRSAMENRVLGDQYLETPLNTSDHKLFIELLSEEESRKQLLVKAEEQRQLVKLYFNQVGLNDDGVGMVDIGWSRFCQHAVNVVLEPKAVFGYFFGVFDQRMSIQEAGSYAAAFYPEEFYSDACNKNLLKHEFLPILEQFFTLNDQRSTIGFKVEGSMVVPVFEEKASAEPYQVLYFEKHMTLIRQFAEEYLRFEKIIHHPELLIRNCGYRSVTMFMTSPTADEAAIFDKFMVDNGLGDPIPLVKKISVRQVMRRASGSATVSPEYIWPEGTIVHSFGEKGLQLLKLGRALKEWYQSGKSITKLPY